MFNFTNKVVKGRGNGKSKLGFATANMVLPHTADSIQYRVRSGIVGAWTLRVIVGGEIKLGLFQREYLQEKAHKYLGDVDFGEIDHNKIIDTYYGNKSADDLSILDIESLLTSLPIMKVSDRANLSPETTDDSFCKGWVVDRFKVIGCDHETTSDIEEYLYYLGEEGQDRIIELLRDLQIQECLK